MAPRAFGTHQIEAQYDELIWKFTPKAVERAAGVRAHSDQILET
jgi:hypothetical protein